MMFEYFVAAFGAVNARALRQRGDLQPDNCSFQPVEAATQTWRARHSGCHLKSEGWNTNIRNKIVGRQSAPMAVASLL